MRKLTVVDRPAAEQREVSAVRSGEEWFDTSGNVIQVTAVRSANVQSVQDV